MPEPIPPGTRAVFFDAVGTLLFPDPPAAVVYAEVARRAGLTLDPAEARGRFLAAFRAEEEADRLAGWVTSEEREVARWRRIVRDSFAGAPEWEVAFRELFGHFAKPAAWRLDPDAHTVFARLRGHGLVLGMGSNYDSRLLSVVGGTPELAPVGGRVVVSAAVGFRKPAKQFFRAVADAANCRLNEVLFVGDDLGNDYEGATAAGLRAVLLDPRDTHTHIRQRMRSLRELLA